MQSKRKTIQKFPCKASTFDNCNSLDIFEGLITRRRKTTRGLEEAILDFFIVCDKMRTFIERMVVDDDKLYALSKYVKVKGDFVKKESDQ